MEQSHESSTYGDIWNRHCNLKEMEVRAQVTTDYRNCIWFRYYKNRSDIGSCSMVEDPAFALHPTSNMYGPLLSPNIVTHHFWTDIWNLRSISKPHAYGVCQEGPNPLAHKRWSHRFTCTVSLMQLNNMVSHHRSVKVSCKNVCS